MTDRYSIDCSNGIVEIFPSNHLTFDGAKTIIDDLAKNYPAGNRLWNFDGTNFNLTVDELIDIANYVNIEINKPPKTAFVAPDDLAYGELRMYQVYRDQAEISTAGVFRTKKEALDWLN